MNCIFSVVDGTCVCSVCGRAIPNLGEERCVNTRRNCGDRGVINKPLIEQIPCIHRGELGPPLKCDCGKQGFERWYDTFRCNSPDQPRRSCIIAGQIRMEPEASLYAVCAQCQWREPSPL